MPASTTPATPLPQVGEVYARRNVTHAYGANIIVITSVGPEGDWPAGYINDPVISYHYATSSTEWECYLRDFDRLYMRWESPLPPFDLDAPCLCGAPMISPGRCDVDECVCNSEEVR